MKSYENVVRLSPRELWAPKKNLTEIFKSYLNEEQTTLCLSKQQLANKKMSDLSSLFDAIPYGYKAVIMEGNKLNQLRQIELRCAFGLITKSVECLDLTNNGLDELSHIEMKDIIPSHIKTVVIGNKTMSFGESSPSSLVKCSVFEPTKGDSESVSVSSFKLKQ